MATRPVRFEFQCEKETLKYTHPIPHTLVRPNAEAAQTDPQYVNAFVSAISPIMREHEPTCRAASSPHCGACEAPTKTVLMTPMSWLHIVDDPFVNVFANPVCGKGECETKTRQQIQDMMMLMSQNGGGVGPDRVKESLEVLPCGVCGKTEKTSRCSRCRIRAYCGKEHQKQDWPAHKAACKKASR